MKELQFAARRLRHSPGFALTALLVLAIAIGLNTAIFSVVDALILRPLPYPQPGRIVQVSENMDNFGFVGTAYANFLDWRKEAQTLEASSVVKPNEVTLSDRGVAERIPAVAVSAGFFDVVHTYPALGNAFRPADDLKGAGGRAVITDSLWRRHFGTDPGVIGKSVVLDGKSFTIVGVMPASFAFPLTRCDVLIPFGPDADLDRGNHGGLAIARVKPGIPMGQANAELHAIGTRLAMAHPKENEGWSLSVGSLQDFLTKDFRGAMFLLLAGAGLVLVIACVNLAGLMLVREAGRRREVAVRTALGASPWSLVTGTLSEAVLLAICGSVLGVLAGSWGVAGLLSFLPADTPAPPIGLDFRLITFAIGITGFCCVVFGLIPALRTLGSDPHEALKESGRANTGGMQGNRLRGALVVAEIGLALVLAFSAGLVGKSFEKLMHVDPGFEARRATTMRVELNGERYENDGSTVFWNHLVHTLGQQPAIASVGLVSFLPFSNYDTQSGYLVEGRPAPKNDSQLAFADRFIIGGNYLDAMGIALLKGRDFRLTDDSKSTRVLLIDEDFARKNFPNDDPLRHRIVHDKQAWQIVGVVRHVKAYGLDGTQTREQFYFAYPQFARTAMTIAVRPAGDRATAVTAVRNAVRSVDAGVPVSEIRSMEDWLKDSTWHNRLSTLLLALFASVALILAAIGIYGVMAYSVGQRTQEIGIRMALGATPSSVLGLVMRQACLLSGAGIVIGALLAIPIAGLLRSLLFEVSPGDAGVFSRAAILLAAIALAGGVIPAIRASQTDPLSAMRYE